MVSGDEEVKLLLEAFQMSVSACLSHPQTPVLRAQMLGRLMAVNLSASVKVSAHAPRSHVASSTQHHLISPALLEACLVKSRLVL